MPRALAQAKSGILPTVVQTGDAITRGLRRLGIRAALLAVAAALALAAPARAADATVDVGDFKFTPASVTINQGEQVTWNWVGPDLIHNVHAADGSFDSHPGGGAGSPPGGKYSHTFKVPGTFTYFCQVHTFMRAQVTVNPAAATSPGPAAATSPGPAAQGTPAPSFKECISRRNFRIRLREPGGMRLASAKVTVDGKPAPVTTTTMGGRSRLVAQVDLRGLPKGQYTVDITATTRDRKTFHGTRRYMTCAPKIPSYFLPKL
jgi:plastocyanin